MSDFMGFPPAALDFYDDLEMDNSKAFWEKNKHIWLESVKVPMTALTDALAVEFGEAKIFRPYRDVRFARDKTPYKTHQGAFVAVAPGTGWYVQIGAAGVWVGAGFYGASPQRLAAIREAIDDARLGLQLASILTRLQAGGWTLGGDRLKTSPRGFTADHPRIELLRHKSLSVGVDYGFGAKIQTPGLVGLVRRDWRKTRDLMDWLVNVPKATTG